jgi:hypothetical protein
MELAESAAKRKRENDWTGIVARSGKDSYKINLGVEKTTDSGPMADKDYYLPGFVPVIVSSAAQELIDATSRLSDNSSRDVRVAQTETSTSLCPLPDEEHSDQRDPYGVSKSSVVDVGRGVDGDYADGPDDDGAENDSAGSEPDAGDDPEMADS